MYLLRFFEQLFRVDPSVILADYLGDLEDKQFEQFFIDHVVANVAKQLPQRRTDFASICLAVRQIKRPDPSLIQDDWKAALEKVKKTLDHDINKTIIDAFILIIEESMIIADIVEHYSSQEPVDDSRGIKAKSPMLQQFTYDYFIEPTAPVASDTFDRIVLPSIMQLIRLDPTIIEMQEKEKDIGADDRLSAVSRIIDTLELPNNLHPGLLDTLEAYRCNLVQQITQLQISASRRVKLKPQQQLLNQQQQEQLGLKMGVIAAMISTLKHKIADEEIIHSDPDNDGSDDTDDIYSGMSRMFN